MNINDVYSEIKEILKARGEDEHLNNLEKIIHAPGLLYASEIWGEIGKYLRDLRKEDIEMYKILESLIQKFTHFQSCPDENEEYTSMTYKDLLKHAETILSEDKKYQVRKFYTETGRLMCEFPYPYLSDGVAKWYYENGKIKKEVIRKDGKEVATKKYDENGNEIK